jgi:hypothetical protein
MLCKTEQIKKKRLTVKSFFPNLYLRLKKFFLSHLQIHMYFEF